MLMSLSRISHYIAQLKVFYVQVCLEFIPTLNRIKYIETKMHIYRANFSFLNMHALIQMKQVSTNFKNSFQQQRMRIRFTRANNYMYGVCFNNGICHPISRRGPRQSALELVFLLSDTGRSSGYVFIQFGHPYLSHDIRKPVFALCDQHLCRSPMHPRWLISTFVGNLFDTAINSFCC